MQVRSTVIPEVKIVTTMRHEDARGFLTESYNRRAFVDAGIAPEFVQDNHSFSLHKGTVRGLHFQSPPFAQDKLIRVVRGAIFDVALDLRKGSPTFGKHVSFVLSADDENQIFIPVGFAHGFCTLEPETDLLYKVTNYYSAQHDLGVLWNDPDLGIDWPVAPEDAVVSEKDRRQPRLRDLPDYFYYGVSDVRSSGLRRREAE